MPREGCRGVVYFVFFPCGFKPFARWVLRVGVKYPNDVFQKVDDSLFCFHVFSLIGRPPFFPLAFEAFDFALLFFVPAILAPCDEIQVGSMVVPQCGQGVSMPAVGNAVLIGLVGFLFIGVSSSLLGGLRGVVFLSIR